MGGRIQSVRLPLNVECFVDMFDYSVQSVNNAYRSVWKPEVTENLLKIYSGQIPLRRECRRSRTASGKLPRMIKKGY